MKKTSIDIPTRKMDPSNKMNTDIIFKKFKIYFKSVKFEENPSKKYMWVLSFHTSLDND